MITYENECCDCAVPLYPCIGDSCPRINVRHLYCDRCKLETDEIYDVFGVHFCEDCLRDEFKVTDFD